MLSDAVRSATSVLRSAVVFAAANDDTIAALAPAMRRRAFERSRVFALESSPADRVWLIESGMVRVFTTSADGDEPCLAILTAGDIAGEMGALMETARSASLGALRPSVAWELPGGAFRDAFAADGAVARAVATTLVQRLQVTTSQVNDLLYLDLGGRLAKYLLQCCAKYGRRFDLPLTQGEIGQLVGGARQTVNQLFRSLELAELIAMDGKTVTVIDHEGLTLRSLSAA